MQDKFASPVAVADVVGGLGDAIVLFLDTCAVLDIVRLGSRSANGRAELDAIQGVTSLVERGGVRLVSSDLLRKEWARNVDEVFLQEIREVERLDKRISVLVECARRTGHPDVERGELAPLGTVAALRRLAEALIARVVTIEISPEIAAKAAYRQGEAIPPGRRGKDGLGDCTMVETTLALARTISPRRPIVFLTSNTADFGDENKKPHPSIVEEFGVLTVALAFNWPWALTELRKAPA